MTDVAVRFKIEGVDRSLRRSTDSADTMFGANTSTGARQCRCVGRATARSPSIRTVSVRRCAMLVCKMSSPVV